VVSYDIWCNSKTDDHKAALAKKKIAKPFEYMFPVFVTGKIVVADMEVQKCKWLKKRVDGGLRGQPILECEENKRRPSSSFSIGRD
jgi:hypothetical protein